MKRVVATEEVKDLLKELIAEYKAKGVELIFHQAGGCCEGTKPSLYKKHRFRLRRGDVRIGEIEGVSFWVDKDLFKYWADTQFQIYLVDGLGSGGLSLEISKGKSFLTKHILLTKEELDKIQPNLEIH